MSRTLKDASSVGTRTYKYQRKSEAVVQGTGLEWTNGGITSSLESSSAAASTNKTHAGSKTWFLSNSISNNTASDTTTPDEVTSSKPRKEAAVDLSTLRAKCEKLLPYANTHKYKLPAKQHEIFMEIVGLGMRVAGTDQYNEFHDITNSVFSGYKSSVKGSVANQFIGCAGGKKPCHEECAGAFPDKGYTEKSFCETHVGVYHDGTFDIHYSPAKPCSILLLHSNVPLKINKNVAKQLKSANITTVNVSVNGSVTVHSVNDILSCEPKKKERNDCDDGWLWLMLIFVLVIVILIVSAGMLTRSVWWSNKEPKHNKW